MIWAAVASSLPGHDGVFSGIQPTGEMPPRQLPGRAAALGGRPARAPVVLLRRRPPRADAPVRPGRAAGQDARDGHDAPRRRARPDVCTLFVQSHVPSTPSSPGSSSARRRIGELQRMTQFKDKSAEDRRVHLRRPVRLPGADGRRHPPLRHRPSPGRRRPAPAPRARPRRRDPVQPRYGDTFVVPEAAIPQVGARVMDLQEPTNKMSKSVESPQGTVLVLDAPEVIERKIKPAVTDTDGEVRFDRDAEAGRVEPALDPRREHRRVTRGARRAVHAVRAAEDGHGGRRHRGAAPDPGALRVARRRSRRDDRVLRKGASKAREVASVTYDRARKPSACSNPEPFSASLRPAQLAALDNGTSRTRRRIAPPSRISRRRPP